MSERRIIYCDIKSCKESEEEKGSGEGWRGWSCFQGIQLNGIDNPTLCPKHTTKTAEYIDYLGDK